MLPDTLTKIFFLKNQECLFREDTVFYRVWVFLFHQRDLTDKHTWPVVLKKRHRLVRKCLVRNILKTLSEILKNLGKPTANFIPMFCKQRIEWIIGRVGTYSSWNSSTIQGRKERLDDTSVFVSSSFFSSVSLVFCCVVLRWKKKRIIPWRRSHAHYAN